MSVVPSGLLWSCEEQFLTKNISGERLGTINGRGYYKVTDVPAICVFPTESGIYRCPRLISTDASAVSYWADSGGPWEYNCTFEYLGLTWYYFSGNHGFYNGSMTTEYPMINTGGFATLEEQGQYILQQADVVVLPYYNVHFDANGGYGELSDEYVICGESKALKMNTFINANQNFLGWSKNQSATTPTYTDGQSVTDIGEADETVTLYAVWQKANAWLIGDSHGKIYAVENNMLVELSGSLTASLFKTRGFQFTPPSNLLITLDNPKVYRWVDDETTPKISANVRGIPLVPQKVVFKNVEAETEVKYISISSDANTLYNVSFDGGTTWKYYMNGQWTTVPSDGVGNTKQDLERLSASAWDNVTDVRFRAWLFNGSKFQSIRLDYNE